jgi:ATP-dependent DNA helicase RecG
LITGRQPEREIIPEYPEDAVREAVVNAICHRDYSAVGTVQVRIYEDRLEVWNPGFLPPELTIEALYREHPSLPRNPLLADALYRARVIEQWGTGTLRIVRACRERLMPEPEFSAEMGVFITRFRKRHLSVQTPRRAEVQKRQRDTIAYVRSHGQISAKEYAGLFGLSSRQARRDLETLADEGVLTRRGETRGTYFALPEELTNE